MRRESQKFMNRFFIKTLGCKVNQYESQVIREGFLKNGYVEAENAHQADISIINTCTVTSASDSKSLKSIHSSIKCNQKCVIATGCMIEDRMLDLSKLKGVDFIISNKDKHRIPEIINRSPPYHKGTGQACNSSRGVRISGLKGHTRAFVKVQDGCDNACSYCKVRIVRGSSKSRPFKEVIEECAGLIKNNYKEIVLTGICLGGYGRDVSGDMSLLRLIEEICRIQGDWRLRLSSIEPKDITDELISYMASEDKICRHLHMPFQSGDDEILKRMNRPYKVNDYIGVVNRARKAMPDMAITTDIMVGFPGENQANFQNTVDFIREIRPMRMHVFGFSRRKGTPAYTYKDNISANVKKQRENLLLGLGKELAMEFVDRFIGREVRVLVESKRDRGGFLNGYTDTYIKVSIDGQDSLKSSLITCQLAQAPHQNLCYKDFGGAGLTNQKVYGILFPSLD